MHVAAPSPVGSSWLHAPVAWLLPLAAALVSVLPIVLTAPAYRMTDLLVYLGAGEAAARGSDVYAFRTDLGAPFTYPPFAAMLAVPLAVAPVGLVQGAWVLATLAAVVVLARTALRPVVDRVGLPVTVALVLLSAPMRSHLRFGQVGIFLVLLVTLDLCRRRAPGGLLTGIAAAVKLTPAVFLPWLALSDRRVFRRAVLSAAGCSLLGMLVLWPSTVSYLSEALWDSGRFGPETWAGNQSLRGMLLRTGLPAGAAALAWAALSAGLLVLAVRGARALDRAGNRLGAVGTLAAASVAVSPISWVHHLIWLALPMAALVAAHRERLALAWLVTLTLSIPSLGSAGLRSDLGPAALWHLVIDVQGLTAVATVLLLPRLLASARPQSATAASTDSGRSRRPDRSTSAAGPGRLRPPRP